MKETFDAFVSAIEGEGEVEEKDDLSLLVLNELVLTREKDITGDLSPESLHFELCGMEFFLLKTGDVFTAEEDEGELVVYQLQDSDLLTAVKIFLRLRLKFITELQI